MMKLIKINNNNQLLQKLLKKRKKRRTWHRDAGVSDLKPISSANNISIELIIDAQI